MMIQLYQEAKMKLITELNEQTEILIEEGASGKKNLYLKGIYLQSNIKNRNGRMYPESVMDTEVKRYITEAVDKNTAYGELNHPNSFTINLDKVSHRIVELVKEGPNWIGKALILDTPMGNIAKGIMEGGGRLGVSSRALGSLKLNKEGVNIVQGDFRLSTAADIVADPSAPEAFVQGIMEGKEWVFVDGHYIEKDIAESKRMIQKAPNTRLDEVRVKLFQDFLEKLR